MAEQLRFDEHLKKTGIPQKIEGLMTIGTELLAQEAAHQSPFRESYERNRDGVWKRSDESQPQHYIQLGIHALKGNHTLISFDNHRPLEHRFPEPPVDMNKVIHHQPYEHVALSVGPLKDQTGHDRMFPVLYPHDKHGRPLAPLYVSSLNAEENETAAQKFETSLDQFQESLLLSLSMFGLIQQVQERRMRAAIRAKSS